MARLVRFHAFGGPEVLQLDEVEVGAPGAGEARLRIGAFGLNRVEADYRAGGFGPVPFPARIGYEAAGVIEALGEGVSGFAVGDRVAVLPGVSMQQYGVDGEACLCPADMLVPIDPAQSLTEAAASWMQYLTAYALVIVGGVSAGDRVVITAASSSVGLAAIQIARAAGAVPIAVTRRRDKASALQAHGAAEVIVTDEEDLSARVLALTDGRGARICFDAVGGATLQALAAAVAPGGVLILYGALGGAVVDLPARPLMLHNITLRGYSANWLLEEPERRAAALAFVADGLRSGALRPVINRVFPLEQIVEAHRHLESNQQIGKLVVTTPSAG